MPRTSIDPKMRAKARHLRAGETWAERKLWPHLKALREQGIQFRRQSPIGAYIVDFAWLSGRLIVELDGEQHGVGSRAVRDLQRDAWLASRGFRVLRFWNHNLTENLPGVLDTIAHAALERRPADVSPAGLGSIAISPA